MSRLNRQTLVRSNYPCDLYTSDSMTSHIKTVLKRLNPLRCKVVVLWDTTCSDELKQKITRTIIDADYRLVEVEVEDLGFKPLSMEAFMAFVGVLEQNACTADDIVVAVGDVGVLSLANYTVRTYKAGIGFVAYPTSLKAAYAISVSPRLLDVGQTPCLSAEPCSDQVLLDWSILDEDVDGRLPLLSFLFKGSLVAGDEYYRWLYEFASKLTDHNDDDEATDKLWRNALVYGLHDFASIRNIDWGFELYEAFDRLLNGADEQTVVYETIAFALRLAAGHNKSSIEFIHEVDGCMKRLDYRPCTQVAFDAETLHQTIRESFFTHHNRMLMQVPVAVGIVQPILIDDEILQAHCAAWVKIHR